MKEHEYIEGPEALANFEQLGRAILQAPTAEGKAQEACNLPENLKILIPNLLKPAVEI